MATGIEASITEGLLDHLSDLTLTPAVAVAWPNTQFDPGAISGSYLRPQHFPAPTNQIELGDAGRNRHTGLFQIDVFFARNVGEIDGKEIAASVAAHFKRGTSISQDSISIRIVTPPTVGAAIYSDDRAQIPVTVTYQADAGNPA